MSVWWTVVPVLAIVVVAAVLVVVALAVDTGGSSTASNAPVRPPLVSADPAVRAVAADAPEPTAAGISAQIAAAVRNPALGELTGEISDAITGQTLWSRSPDRAMVPASTTKVLTGAAALLTLPLDKRITTTVVAGQSGQVVLVGAGDPTLSSQPSGTDTFFTDAARISDLAEQIKRTGTAVTSVAVDTSLYTGPSLAPSWEVADIAGGSIAPIQSVMTDSGRINPSELYSPRTPTPAMAAATALAVDLGVPADTVTTATATPNARVLASVRSAPLETRLRDMLGDSDDVLAETMAIEVAQATGGQSSLDGGVAAVTSVLASAGASMNGVALKDTNGLSVDDRIPASTLDGVLRAAAGAGDAKLRPLLEMLPISGATGTLADRFATAGSGGVSGAGWIRAKTGTLTGVNTLAGIVQTKENRVLTFAMMSNGTDPNAARPALDALVTALRGCGCR
nr:D-alanyl-D-alanine carboxypeptidase/D-alanyl-D-alanine-endopeptidase [Williamsia phyllosphaerae]